MAPEHEHEPHYTSVSEQALEIPLERVDPELLRRMMEEFVTREWSELTDSGYTLEEKVAQVHAQLKGKRAKIMYDTLSESWDIVPCR